MDISDAPIKVLITGGAGFIGRALVQRCLGQGLEVSVLDNLCNGKAAHLESFRDRIAFYENDILDAGSMRAVLEARRPDIVFHLAAMHFIPWCDRHPQETIRTNVEGTQVVMSEAARAGTRMCVLASTGALYPSRDALLAEELPAEPKDIYAISKHVMEEMARAMVSMSSMSCVTARLFNVYGPYETNQHLIPDILEFARAGDTIRLGNVHTRRDYIYVDDVADMLLRCARSARERYTVINVGTGVEYSAEDIVSTIAHLLRRALHIETDPAKVRPIDKLHQRAATARLAALAGKLPDTSLSQGLSRLLRHEGF